MKRGQKWEAKDGDIFYRVHGIQQRFRSENSAREWEKAAADEDLLYIHNEFSLHLGSVYLITPAGIGSCCAVILFRLSCLLILSFHRIVCFVFSLFFLLFSCCFFVFVLEWNGKQIKTEHIELTNSLKASVHWNAISAKASERSCEMCVAQYCRISILIKAAAVAQAKISNFYTLFLHHLEQLSERMRSKSIIRRQRKKDEAEEEDVFLWTMCTQLKCLS